MDQTFLRKAFGVSSKYRYERTEYRWDAIFFHLSLKDKALVCPSCNLVDKVIRKGSRHRCLQTVPVGLKPVYLVTEIARCQCRGCNVTFEIHPPFAGRRSATHGNSKSWLSNSVAA